MDITYTLRLQLRMLGRMLESQVHRLHQQQPHQQNVSVFGIICMDHRSVHWTCMYRSEMLDCSHYGEGQGHRVIPGIMP